MRSTAPTLTPPRWDAATWGLLILVSGALFLDGVDLSMVNIALPSIGADLGLTASALAWIVNAYILGYGGFLLLGGRAADLLGRRQVFNIAVAVFGVASIVSAFMSDETSLIVLRFIKGVAAGFTVPAGMSVVSTSFAAGHDRAKALTIYSVIGTMGFGLGLVLGGVLTEFSWRLTMFVPGPISLVFFVAGLRLIPKSRRTRVSLAQFDVLGTLTMTGALLILVYALLQAPTHGWISTSTLVLLAISAALIVAFVRVELRHPHPLVRLGILRNKAVVHANLSAALLLGSFMGFQFVVTLYLQDSLAWTPLAVAMAFVLANIAQPVIGPRMGPVFARRGTTVPTLLAFAALTLGYLLMLRTQPGMSYWNFLMPSMVLVGIAFAIGFPAVNVGATHDVEDAEQGLASGLVNTSLQIGGAIALALVTAVLSSAHAPVEHGQLLPGFKPAMLTVAAMALLGVLVTLPRLAKKPTRT